MAAHGRMPLPAPGTAELLRGVPLADSPVEMELTTPTGAAIVSTVCERFGPLPAMTVDTIGHGAGTKEIHWMAKMSRAQVARPGAASQPSSRATKTNAAESSKKVCGGSSFDKDIRRLSGWVQGQCPTDITATALHCP